MCKDGSEALEIVKVIKENYANNLKDIKDDVRSIFKKLDTITTFVLTENKEQNSNFDEKIKEIKRDIDSKISKEEFAPIKKWVYGAIGSISFMFISAIGGLIFITTTK